VRLNAAVQLTRSFSAEQFASALESWTWVDIAELLPTFTSPFGDIFFQGADGIWFLDLLEGKLTRPWTSRDALKADLNSPEGQNQYLFAGLAFAAQQLGIIPSDSQVLSFKVPPVLGGATAVENVEASDFVVSVNIAGQIHQQIKDLPPGTPITGFTVDGQRP
jgi:hypothetical protein